MWIRTVQGLLFVEVVRTPQGFWTPKSFDYKNTKDETTKKTNIPYRF